MYYTKALDKLKVGDKVKKGDIIGTLQAVSEKYTGTPDHLHYQIQRPFKKGDDKKKRTGPEKAYTALDPFDFHYDITKPKK